MTRMGHDDEFAEFDTTEDDFDAMWAEGVPAGFEFPELVVVRATPLSTEAPMTLSPVFPGMLHLDVRQGDGLTLAGSFL